jgi:hypothetical protein
MEHKRSGVLFYFKKAKTPAYKAGMKRTIGVPPRAGLKAKQKPWASAQGSLTKKLCPAIWLGAGFDATPSLAFAE